MTLQSLLQLGGERVVEHAPFGAITTYRVGGTVRALVTLATREDLAELGPMMVDCGLPVFALGNGSNLLVADGEHEVLGVRLTGDFARLEWHDEHDVVVVTAGAGLDLPVAARRLASEGIEGFEWAVGVPGTFGGAAVMNAGGHGSDMAASLQMVEVWQRGTIAWVARDQLLLGYRKSALGPDQLVLTVTLHLRRGDAAASLEQIRSIVRWRREHQPGGANAGSVFRNPPDVSAGRLIEEAGCRGLRLGSAVVSEKHANFIIADLDGRANDVYALINLIRARVLEHSGVTLHSENRYLGFEDLS
jgi:UDP-N-acetylmuramate dehydrogenase